MLTVGELAKLNQRIQEISNITDLCDAAWDSDVLDNLEAELDYIETIIIESLNSLNGEVYE
jgi:hypothetical protein